MITSWEDLEFWRSGEWQTIEEKLDEMDGQILAGPEGTPVYTAKKTPYCPRREDIFAALDATTFIDVKVAFLGQDPYPSRKHATGLAFSVPRRVVNLPPTAYNLLKEYQTDLRLPNPGHCDLRSWAEEGVLLWNVVPTCEEWKSLSHYGWTEWTYLTREIIGQLSERGCVFVFFGGKAREYVHSVDRQRNAVIEVSHPSPRGASAGRNPFLGSRVFTLVNQKLCERGSQPINWRLL